MPPRAVFVERQWPVGYVFPSCAACNDSTQEEELLIALFSRIAVANPSPRQKEEFEGLFRSVQTRFPRVIEEMKSTSALDVRRWLRKNNLKLADGLSTADVGIVKLPGEVDDIMRRFGDRLGRALHYKHTGRIVPPHGVLRVGWFTNESLLSKTFPHDAFDHLQSQPKIERANVELADQFSYRYAVSDIGEHGVFGCTFGQSFFVACMIAFDPDVAAELNARIARNKALAAGS